MCHCPLHHHVRKKILIKRNMYRKDIERTCVNKLTKLISSVKEKNCSKFFYNASNSPDIEEEIIKQINTVKLLYRKNKKTVKKKLI